MLVYPQLPSGALAQFPAQSRRRMRTLVNVGGGRIVDQARRPGRGDDRVGIAVHRSERYGVKCAAGILLSCEGSLNSFTFVDPTGNLLAWSEDLTNAAWDAAPLLSLAPGSESDTWQLTNSGAAPQALSQL